MAESQKSPSDVKDTSTDVANAPKNEPVQKEATFSHDELIESGRAALGVAPFVVAGALAKVNRKNLTLDEAQTAVNTFLGR